MHWLVHPQRHESPGQAVHGGQVQELHVPCESVVVMVMCLSSILNFFEFLLFQMCHHY